jgi:TM2 domain-containing membrane protein YozV
MNKESAQTLRAKLTFEQQARFDALYERRKKQTGTARTLALPVLGTFGLEHFYLGHTVRGVLSVLFSWTLIPTVTALFDLFSGDIKRQVDYANQRVAQQVYTNVVQHTDQVPAAAASVVNAPAPPAAPTPVVAVAAPVVEATVVVAEAAAVAAPAVAASPAPETVIAADSIPEPVAAAPVEAVAEEADETTTTTANFTRTDTTATWQAGMAEPATTTETQTLTVGETDMVAVADDVALPAAPTPETPVVVVLDEPAAVVVEATPAPAAAEAAPASDFMAAEGVLVFLDDATPLEETPAPSPVVEAVAVDETQQSGSAETISETTSVASQHYQDGKLVNASRTTTTISGEINTLISDHSSLLDEVEASTPAPAGWVDVSPLHPGAPAANARVDTTSGGDQGNSGTNVPGGDLGPGGTNIPGGDLGSGGTSTGGDDGGPTLRPTPDGPVPL